MATTAYEKVLSEAKRLPKNQQIALANELYRIAASGKKRSIFDYMGTVKGVREDAQTQIDAIRREWDRR